MSQQLATQTHQQTKAAQPSISGILQRKCACGQHTIAGSECAECRKKRMSLQRRTTNQTEPATVPPIVHEVLRSPGQPLGSDVREFIEPRFGHDLSRVRVHTDAKAAQSARAVNSRAYTVGNNIVFGAGQFAPSTQEGKRLLAHELTHVVQQSSSGTLQSQLVVQPASDAYEREADQVAGQVVNGSVTNPGTSIVHAMVNEGIQRYEFGEGAGPDFGGGIRYVPVPDDERARVEAALAIVSRVVNNPRDFPACPRFFRDNCPGGSDTALYDAFNRAVIWREVGSPAGDGGSTAGVGGENIAYTDLSYRIGRWAMAASFIHEFMHVCGQASHDIGDQAKNVCGRLPNIIALSPRIRISNPIR